MYKYDDNVKLSICYENKKIVYKYYVDNIAEYTIEIIDIGDDLVISDTVKLSDLMNILKESEDAEVLENSTVGLKVNKKMLKFRTIRKIRIDNKLSDSIQITM